MTDGGNELVEQLVALGKIKGGEMEFARQLVLCLEQAGVCVEDDLEIILGFRDKLRGVTGVCTESVELEPHASTGAYLSFRYDHEMLEKGGMLEHPINRGYGLAEYLSKETDVRVWYDVALLNMGYQLMVAFPGTRWMMDVTALKDQF